MTLDYTDFLSTKRLVAQPSGFDVSLNDLNPALFEWQKSIVLWGLKRGKAAFFQDCGLGKSIQQLEWAYHVSVHTGKPVLILAPLAVAEQTAREGAKFGIPVTVAARQSDVVNGINVTNYQKLHHFDTSAFGGVVIDESSILKSLDGKLRTQIIESFRDTPYKLACTATPAPNDFMELGNHSAFLGVMSSSEMLATFFTHDGGDTSQWRLKGHAQSEFWKWVCSWSVMVRQPSDLGYSDDGFVIPPITREQVTVTVEHQFDAAEGAQLYLIPVEAKTLNERRNARKVSLQDRVEAVAELVNADSEPWVVWCNLNDESKALCAAIPDAVEVTGSDSDEHKAKAMLDFAEGRIRVLVSKPSICGFGMNWQHCNNMAFVGLSDSYEQMYQAERRCWRFGQQREVSVYIVVSELEGAVVRNIERKQQQYEQMVAGMLEHMRAFSVENVRGLERETMAYEPARRMTIPTWLQSEVYV